jgi:hypothetical protein
MEFCRRVIFLSFLLYLCFGIFGQNSSIRAEPSGGEKTKKEGADEVNQSGLVDQIIAEIRNLRKRHLKFKTYSEKPVTIIGKPRGGEQSVRVPTKDIADYAVEISTTTFFSRTYTIDHRKE